MEGIAMGVKTIDTTGTVELPEYNGWKNYATWNVMLWLNNDEPSYRAMQDFARTTPDIHDVTAFIKRYIKDSNTFRYGTAEDIRPWARQHGKSLLWAMGQIDYPRIREAIMETIEG
jgi:hypothetical protein